MDAALRQEIEFECQRLVMRFAHFVDRKEHDAVAALFSDDAVWLRGGAVLTGLAAIRAALPDDATAVARHFVSGSTFEIADENHASGITDYLFFRFDPGKAAAELPLPLDPPFSIGAWHDSFTRGPDGWRISRREARRVFQQRAPG